MVGKLTRMSAGLILILFAGCAVTHTNDSIAISSIPQGVFEFSASSPEFEMAYSFDPWTGIELAVGGIVDLGTAILGPLFPAIPDPAPAPTP